MSHGEQGPAGRHMFYALGGGLGHVTRIRALIHTLDLAGPMVTLSSSSLAAAPPFAPTPHVLLPPAASRQRPQALQRWVQACIRQFQPRDFWVDAFPAGILGELDAIPELAGVNCSHIARLLHWPRYQARLPARPLHYRRAYVCETLTAPHLAYLQNRSETLAPLNLTDPPPPPAALRNPLAATHGADSERWLIVHAGPAQETQALIRHAERLKQRAQSAVQLLLVTPRHSDSLPTSIPSIAAYPLEPLLPHADRLISACGFNMMRQAQACAIPHDFLAFPRALDNQLLRGLRRRQAWPRTASHQSVAKR